MRTEKLKSDFTISFMVLVIFFSILFSSFAFAEDSGEEKYQAFSKIARTGENASLFSMLNEIPRGLDWANSERIEFQGNLRILSVKDTTAFNDQTTLYLLRKSTGEILNLTVPVDENPFYLNLKKMSESKMIFKVELLKSEIDGEAYTFARFVEQPVQPVFDKIFKISIILMLFLIMVGMGMTLTLEEFAIVFKNPMGILIGEILQFGVIPAIALLIGYLSGFYEEYPYIYVGFILIAVSPGGVTSNLMTHYAKGDLALSISITSFSTVLALFFTPFLLGLYCKNVPEVTIPVKTIVLTVSILVVIPLIVGMIIKHFWSKFAEKATPFFSALGIIAVLFIMVAGVISNFEKIADFERYGFKFYSMVFLLTMSGMVLGGVIPKLVKINNYQARAISLETGLRNAALAMTLALLIQDQMGDFHSSMFTVSGVFGLLMYISGLISIRSFNMFLPIKNKTANDSDSETSDLVFQSE